MSRILYAAKLYLRAIAAVTLTVGAASEPAQESSHYEVMGPEGASLEAGSKVLVDRLAAVELNGYFSDGEGVLVSLRDPSGNYWIAVGKGEHGLVVDSFNLAEQSVTVACGSAVRVIKLKRDKIKSIPLTTRDELWNPSIPPRDPDAVRLERAAEEELIISMSVSQIVIEEKLQEQRSQHRRELAKRQEKRRSN